MAKARKKREKEARKVQRTGSGPDEGVEFDLDGFPILPESEVPEEGAEPAEGGEAAEGDVVASEGSAPAEEPPAATPPPPA